jgi:hypothetical protein
MKAERKKAVMNESGNGDLSEAERFLAEIGKWEADGVTFTFFREQSIGGNTAKQIVAPQMELPDGITREDLIVIMLNPELESKVVDAETGMMGVDFTLPVRESEEGELDEGDWQGFD